MRAILLLLAIVAVVSLLLRWFVRTPAPVITRNLPGILIGVIAAALVVLAISGRLHWLLALLGALLAAALRMLPVLVRLLPLFAQLSRRFRRSPAPPAGTVSHNRSTVEAKYLKMTLDHDSGEMAGTILAGQFRGKQLADLSFEQLLSLYRECSADDQDSASLLSAYLDRVHGAEWQARVHAGQARHPAADGAMTDEEAYRILGLAPGASEKEIVEQHRRLMQKVHPDRGGSDYLAAKINQAKDLLVGK